MLHKLDVHYINILFPFNNKGHLLFMLFFSDWTILNIVILILCKCKHTWHFRKNFWLWRVFEWFIIMITCDRTFLIRFQSFQFDGSVTQRLQNMVTHGIIWLSRRGSLSVNERYTFVIIVYFFLVCNQLFLEMGVGYPSPTFSQPYHSLFYVCIYCSACMQALFYNVLHLHSVF